MESYLIKINCRCAFKLIDESNKNINVLSFKDVTQIDFEKLKFLESQIVICIEVNNYNHLQGIIKSKAIDNLNVPTIFILAQQDEKMIKMLYSVHQINICFRYQPEILLTEQINYMFENYNLSLIHI